MSINEHQQLVSTATLPVFQQLMDVTASANHFIQTPSLSEQSSSIVQTTPSDSQEIYSNDELTDDDLEFLLSESMGENRIIPAVSSPIPPFQGSFSSASATYSQPIQSTISPPVSISSQIPPPSFSIPPKLKSVQDVMNDRLGTDVQHLRELAIALARDAILARKS